MHFLGPEVWAHLSPVPRVFGARPLNTGLWLERLHLGALAHRPQPSIAGAFFLPGRAPPVGKGMKWQAAP